MIATRPTTRPVEAPTSVVFLLIRVSISIHERSAEAAEIPDVIKAWAARPSALSELPALKPNQPNQRSDAPSTTNGIL